MQNTAFVCLMMKMNVLPYLPHKTWICYKLPMSLFIMLLISKAKSWCPLEIHSAVKMQETLKYHHFFLCLAMFFWRLPHQESIDLFLLSPCRSLEIGRRPSDKVSILSLLLELKIVFQLNLNNLIYKNRINNAV